MLNTKLTTEQRCVNCDNYNWSQPPRKSTLKRCANCQLLCYCSQECQVEHWKKVHKRHCKYLSGKKNQINVKHEPRKCQYCIKEAHIGMDTTCSTENTYLGCHWNLSEFTRKPDDHQIFLLTRMVPSPFQLGEITNQYQSLLEHTLVTLLRIHNKMQKSYGYLNRKVIINIMHMRELLRTTYCFINSKGSKNPHIYYQQNLKLALTLCQLCNEDVQSLESDIVNKGLQDKLKLLNSYKLLIGFLEFHLIPEDISYDTHENHVKISYEYLESTWRKIIYKLESDNWSYEKLVNIFNTGGDNSKCYNCVTHVYNVNYAIWLNEMSNKYVKTQLAPSIVIAAPLPSLIFICEKPECVNKVHAMISKDMKNISFSPNYCDNCFKRILKGHRCSRCLTKLYCGNDCIKSDWTTHKEFCKKNQRKQKMNQKERTIDQKMFNKFLSI